MIIHGLPRATGFPGRVGPGLRTLGSTTQHTYVCAMSNGYTGAIHNDGVFDTVEAFIHDRQLFLTGSRTYTSPQGLRCNLHVNKLLYPWAQRVDKFV
jgi:hypothetical protein